jgi:hypothetical protein
MDRHIGHTARKQYLPRKEEAKLFAKPKEYQKHSQKVMLKLINICQYILKFYYKRCIKKYIYSHLKLMTTGTVNSFQLLNKFHGWRKIHNIRTLSKKSAYGNSISMLTSQRTSLKTIKNDACFSYFETFWQLFWDILTAILRHFDSYFETFRQLFWDILTAVLDFLT